MTNFLTGPIVRDLRALRQFTQICPSVNIMPSKAKKAEAIRNELMGKCFLESGPPSWRRRIEAYTVYEDGRPYVAMEGLDLLLEGTPIFSDIRENLEKQSPKVDFLWRLDFLGHFPISVRRAYDEDPEVWDVTFLAAAVIELESCGRLLLDAELAKFTNIFDYRLSRRDFRKILDRGPPAWIQDVEAESTYLPTSQKVLLTKTGLDLFLRIVPIRARQYLEIGGEPTDELDLWRAHFIEEDAPPMYVRQSYKEDKVVVDMESVRCVYNGLLKKNGKKPLTRGHFMSYVQKVVKKPKYGLGPPNMGYGSFNDDAEHTKGALTTNGTSCGSGFVGPKVFMETRPEDLAKTQTLREETILRAQIEIANERARELRAARRRGIGITSLAPPIGLQEDNVAENDLQLTDATNATDVEPPMNRAARRRRALEERRAEKRRARESQKSTEDALQFWKECRLGFEASHRGKPTDTTLQETTHNILPLTKEDAKPLRKARGSNKATNKPQILTRGVVQQLLLAECT